jgi:hypothetical protein
MTGAMQVARDEDVHVDGCDIDFALHVTPDSDLPPSKGGVETVRTTRKVR